MGHLQMVYTTRSMRHLLLEVEQDAKQGRQFFRGPYKLHLSEFAGSPTSACTFLSPVLVPCEVSLWPLKLWCS